MSRQQSSLMRRRAVLAVGLMAVSLLAACGGDYPLHSNMTNTAIREKVGAEFTPGMTEGDVASKLTELRVSEKWRYWYDAAADRPRVLLARLHQPGGFWLHDEDERVEWVDLSFLFGGEGGTLSEWRLFRDGQRYFQGDPIHSPKREPMHRTPRWPGSPPPPRDPLEGTSQT